MSDPTIEEQEETPRPTPAPKLDLEAVLDQAYERTDPLPERDRRPGHSDACFTMGAIQKMNEEGAYGDAAEHLAKCAACRKAVTNAAVVEREHDSELAILKARSAHSVRSRITGLLDRFRTPEREFRHAILGLPDRPGGVFDIFEPAGRLETTRVRVVPTGSALFFEKLNRGSLELGGAIRAHGAEVEPFDVDHDGALDFLDVYFPDGELAPAVRQGLENDQVVVDQVTVSGTFADGESVLLGQAMLEFHPGGKKP